MKKTILFMCFLILLIFSTTSCVKDEFNIDNIATSEWSPNVAAPIINSNLNMWDLMNDYDSSEVFEEYNTKLIYLVYQGDIATNTMENYINIPSQNQSFGQITINIPGGNLSGDYEVTQNYSFNLSLPNGMILDTMILKSLDLSLNINHDINYPIDIDFSINNATVNSSPHNESFSVPSFNYDYSQHYDNIKLRLGANNQISFDIKITIHGDGSANLSPYYFILSIAMNNIGFSKLFGYLGNYNLNLDNDTITIDLYNNHFDGIINWEDPKIFLNASNSVGAPVSINLNQITANRTNPPISTLNITTSIPNPWTVSFPSLSEIGQSKISYQQINKTNSNIVDAFNISPNSIDIIADAQINSNGQSNFLIDTSRLHLNARAELPLHGTAKDFTLIDTVELDLGDSTYFKYVDWFMFKILTNNFYPIDADVQVYLLDSLNNVLDSIIPANQRIAASGVVGPGPDYRVLTPSSKMTTNRFEGSRKDALVNVRKAVIKAVLNTTDHGSSIVKIYSYEYINVRVSAQAQLNNVTF
ncbi:MAG: hypothetical protein QMD02_01585 [Bacteroidales bacterium]|nr:hypothetical protein [Bacteroidales bacterium]